MTSFVSHTTIDCGNAYELSEWWKRLLGYVDIDDDPNEPGHQECAIRDPDTGHEILFIEVPEPKSVKNRIHFDLRPRTGSRDDEIERVLGLGAREVSDHPASTARALAGSSSPTRKATSCASSARRPRWPPAGRQAGEPARP
jgi:hypothetical protein